MSVGIFALDPAVLDPQYNFDFTYLKDDGTKYQRGGREYKKPYGWNRIALNVKNKYESREWLWEDGGWEWVKVSGARTKAVEADFSGFRERNDDSDSDLSSLWKTKDWTEADSTMEDCLDREALE